MVDRHDPFEHGVGRRKLLRASAATGATAATVAAAGCLGDDEPVPGPTVYVFNTGEMTVTLIDAETTAVVRTEYLGATSSWPANQYASINPDITTLWLNVTGGVYGFSATEDLAQVAAVETGSDANWQELTPDGDSLVISAREPAHTHYRVDADPDSDTFGEITGAIDRAGESDPPPAPCDITFGPDGAYAYCPDRDTDLVSVIRTDPFELATQIEVEPLAMDRVAPFMATASWDGAYLAVENLADEGDGTESIFDITDPETPEELHRFTAADGLGRNPMTSEWGPDSELLYVFTDTVTVIDVTELAVVEQIDVGGVTRTGTWDPARAHLYVPVQGTDEVAVIDHDGLELATTLEVGASPRGATARFVRPNATVQGRVLGALASVGFTFDGAATTYCEHDCHCGHHE